MDLSCRGLKGAMKVLRKEFEWQNIFAYDFFSFDFYDFMI